MTDLQYLSSACVLSAWRTNSHKWNFWSEGIWTCYNNRYYQL
jgi:hypothetical protein